MRQAASPRQIVTRGRIAVLGAGVQGCLAALELAARGYGVELFDREAECVTQTSATNEGKIHLGYVYANDRSRRTSRMMLRGALAFAPLMRRWLGSDVDRMAVSARARYAVHAASLLTPEEVGHHLDACVGMARELPGSRRGDYFGHDVCEPVQRVANGDLEADFDSRHVAAVFATNEIAIDPEVLAGRIREAVST